MNIQARAIKKCSTLHTYPPEEAAPQTTPQIRGIQVIGSSTATLSARYF